MPLVDFRHKMYYYSAMTIEEIKKIMDARGMTIRELAQELGMNESGLGEILRGKRKLTDTLSRHIALILGKREAVLVYTIDIDEKRVKELTAGRGCVTDADHKAAMDAIIHANLQELIRLGATLDWSPEERRALGLDD